MAKRGRRKTSENNVNIFENRSYRNIAYGAATVLVLFVIGALGLGILQRSGNIGEPGVDTERTETRTYTVREGDTLWSISQDLYNDAYKWPMLAEANDLESPDAIELGMTLVVPEITPEATQASLVSPIAQAVSPTESPTVPSTKAPTVTKPPISQSPVSDAPVGSKGAATGGQVSQVPSNMQKITGNSYTVVEGDNLWDIAVRAYGDGYKWSEVAEANKIVNPDLIYPGNKFTLPR